MSGQHQGIWLASSMVGRIAAGKREDRADSRMTFGESDASVTGEMYAYASTLYPQKDGWCAPRIAVGRVGEPFLDAMLSVGLRQYGLAPTKGGMIVRLDVDGNATDECVATKRSEK